MTNKMVAHTNDCLGEWHYTVIALAIRECIVLSWETFSPNPNYKSNFSKILKVSKVSGKLKYHQKSVHSRGGFWAIISKFLKFDFCYHTRLAFLTPNIWLVIFHLVTCTKIPKNQWRHKIGPSTIRIWIWSFQIFKIWNNFPEETRSPKRKYPKNVILHH